jgi:hypothetical protein
MMSTGVWGPSSMPQCHPWKLKEEHLRPSSAKGAGGEAVGPGYDNVLQRMKGWNMRDTTTKLLAWMVM